MVLGISSQKGKESKLFPRNGSQHAERVFDRNEAGSESVSAPGRAAQGDSFSSRTTKRFRVRRKSPVGEIQVRSSREKRHSQRCQRGICCSGSSQHGAAPMLTAFYRHESRTILVSHPSYRSTYYQQHLSHQGDFAGRRLQHTM